MGDVTQLLQKWREGSHEAEDELFTLVLPNLRRLAHYLMKGERQGHSLQPTELVDQVYFRLVAVKNRDWQNRGHFFAIAGRAMRRHLMTTPADVPTLNWSRSMEFRIFFPPVALRWTWQLPWTGCWIGSQPRSRNGARWWS